MLLIVVSINVPAYLVLLIYWSGLCDVINLITLVMGQNKIFSSSLYPRVTEAMNRFYNIRS